MASEDVCDVCKGKKNVEPVTITWRGRSFVVDLCARETKTLEEWEAAGSLTPRKGAAPKAPPSAHRVIPID